MIKPIRILSISSALVLGLSFTQVAHAQTLEEIAEAEAACAEALADGSVEALQQFRERYGNLPTACTAVAKVRSASIASGLFDVNEGKSSTAGGSAGGSVSIGSGTGGGGGNVGSSNGGGGNGGDGGSGGNPIIEMLRNNHTDGTGVVDNTLNDMQSRFDAS